MAKKMSAGKVTAISRPGDIGEPEAPEAPEAPEEEEFVDLTPKPPKLPGEPGGALEAIRREQDQRHDGNERLIWTGPPSADPGYQGATHVWRLRNGAFLSRALSKKP